MDSDAHKIKPVEMDPQTRLEQERRDLLAACRLVAKHVAWTIHARKTQGIVETSMSLSTVARYLAAEIEALEQAE
jgi:zona occludens toxin (predicted ATPase)